MRPKRLGGPPYEVWSGVGLVRVLPVRRTEARGGQGTIRRDFPWPPFYAKDGGADGCPCLCHEGSLHEA